MGHVRKDTLTAPPEWWKHLKWNKRVVSKHERKAARVLIDNETSDFFDTENLKTVETVNKILEVKPPR